MEMEGISRSPKSLQVKSDNYLLAENIDELLVDLMNYVGLFYCFIDSAFKQQRLTAWQPILTAGALYIFLIVPDCNFNLNCAHCSQTGTVLPTFFVIGILFIPVRIILS